MNIQTNEDSVLIKQDLNTCSYCNSEDEKQCPIGNYKVTLEPVYLAGSEKLVCQSCLHEHFHVLTSDYKNGQNDTNKKAIWRKLAGSVLIILNFWVLFFVIMNHR